MSLMESTKVIHEHHVYLHSDAFQKNNFKTVCLPFHLIDPSSNPRPKNAIPRHPIPVQHVKMSELVNKAIENNLKSITDAKTKIAKFLLIENVTRWEILLAHLVKNKTKKFSKTLNKLNKIVSKGVKGSEMSRSAREELLDILCIRKDATHLGLMKLIEGKFYPIPEMKEPLTKSHDIQKIANLLFYSLLDVEAQYENQAEYKIYY